MSAAITGPEPQATNQQNPQVEPDQRERDENRELTPDRPPQPVEGGEKPKRPRGFAAMDRKLVSEIARKGGKAAHSAGTAHEFTSEEARIAGRKGGRATHAKRRKAIEDQQGSKTGE
jgi:general stress protein YciG